MAKAANNSKTPPPETGWFWMLNAAAERIAEVGTTAFSVYAVLARHTDSDRSCYPSIDRIGKFTGLKRRAVLYALQTLKAAGWIRITKRARNCNTYHLPPISVVQANALVQADAPETCKRLHNSGARDCTQKDTNEGNQLRKPSCPKLRFDEADLKTAEWMFEKIRELNPSHKKPNLEKWANEIRLIRERDKRTDKGIRDLFEWANADDFWGSNILSPVKLRKRWDQLTIKQGANGNGKAAKSAPTPRKLT